MSINIPIPLKILLVEDSDYKSDKVKAILTEDFPSANIIIAQNIIDAQQELLKQKFDLLIVDMQLPNRAGDNEIEKNGGMGIIEDLYIDDNYLMPTNIIALTEYSDSENELRESYPEIAIIKYDSSSEKWKTVLQRKIKSCSKSKLDQMTIIYCEGDNHLYYNLIGFNNIEFRGLSNSRSVYLAAKNEKDKFAIRDRDFITSFEKEKLISTHKNYFILSLYSIENYLFHPENIKEAYPEFDIAAYIDNLTQQKEEKVYTIIQDYKMSRNGYFDLNDNSSHIDKNPEAEIVEALKSNELSRFYTFFDMAGKSDSDNKKSYDRSFLAKANLDKKLLARTNWFKINIGEIIPLQNK